MVLAVLAAAAVAQAEPRDPVTVPDADLLEFLGSWQAGEKDPRWVDPFQLDDTPPREQDVYGPADRERKNQPLPSGNDAGHRENQPATPRRGITP